MNAKNSRCAAILLALALLSACATRRADYENRRAEAQQPLQELQAPPPGPLPESWAAAEASLDPFAGQAELRLDELLTQVQRRNPTLAAMQSAWRVAVARYPQVTSLEDPMLSAMIGPRTIGGPTVGSGMARKELAFAYRIDASQKLPWPGKLKLEGKAALAEADAARDELETARQKLIQESKSAFFDYYLAQRGLEINAINQGLLDEFRSIAESKYEAGTGSKQSVLQAEVDHRHLEQRELMYKRMKKEAQSKINTLLNARPDAALPSPPAELKAPVAPGDAAELRNSAAARRSELRALTDKIRAAEATLGRARKEYFPDLTLLAAYDAFWEEEQLRPMVGLGFNVPIQIGKRRAAVEQARAELDKLKAELAEGLANVAMEVQVAYDQLTESGYVIHLYASSLLPAEQENLEAARSGYEAGQVDFLTLITAQRSLMDERFAYHEALVAARDRLADLEKAVGSSLDGSDSAQGGSGQ